MGHMTRFDSIDLIENIFKNAFRPIGFETGRPLQPDSGDTRQEARLIRMDVHENDQEYRISAELSGIKKEDVNWGYSCRRFRNIRFKCVCNDLNVV